MQDNWSRSDTVGTVRGLRVQRRPHAQADSRLEAVHGVRRPDWRPALERCLDELLAAPAHA